jgi:hypothetical protein
VRRRRSRRGGEEEECEMVEFVVVDVHHLIYN